jgi:hypothetical protein
MPYIIVATKSTVSTRWPIGEPYFTVTTPQRTFQVGGMASTLRSPSLCFVFQEIPKAGCPRTARTDHNVTHWEPLWITTKLFPHALRVFSPFNPLDHGSETAKIVVQ